MSLIKEISEDLKYAYAIAFEKAKSEFEFKGTNGPIIAIHGFKGGWAKRGFRSYMTKNSICGTLVYLGGIENGLDSYLVKVDEHLNKHLNSLLVGFSAGGIIALKYASEYGWNKFKKIITVASPLFGSPAADKFKFASKTLKELSIDSNYLKDIRKINPPKNKVLSIFADNDLKAPFKNIQTLNWPTVIVGNRTTHGEIHSNYKIIEQIINKEVGI